MRAKLYFFGGGGKADHRLAHFGIGAGGARRTEEVEEKISACV